MLPSPMITPLLSPTNPPPVISTTLAEAVTKHSTLPPDISWVTADLRDFSYHVDRDDDGRKFSSLTHGQDSFSCTQRFTDSFLGLIGQSSSVFDLFSPKEVLDRAGSSGSKNVRVAIAPKPNGGYHALAMTNPDKPMMNYLDVMSAINETPFYTGYHEGVFTMHLKPKIANQMMIAGECHDPFISLHVPMDGYGSPTSFLAMLRQICQNGMVAMDKVFKTTVQFGREDPSDTLSRFVKSFYDEDGYADLRDKLELASATPASIRELRNVNNMLVKDRSVSMAVLGKFSRIVGDTMAKYGIATMESIGEKRASMLPTGVSVYSLINMATEVSTHIASASLRHQLNGLVGSFMSSTYDFEGLNSIDEENRPALYFVGKSDAPPAIYSVADDDADAASVDHVIEFAG